MLNHRLLAAAGCALALAAALACPTHAAAQRKPNLLFILTDDQRWDMFHAAGNPVLQTPNMDRLAGEGVMFRNMFVTTAICAASRASIFTGLHERTHRYTFGTRPIAANHWQTGYPAVLKQAGYRTGFVGKFGVDVADGLHKQAFDSFTPLNRTPYFKRQADGSEKHLTDIEGAAAVAFLDALKPDENFCLSLSFNAPHAEDQDPRQYIWSHASDGLYADARLTPPKTMAEEFFQAQPDFLKNSESRVRFHWRFDEPQKYQEMVKGYYRMITDVDRVIGRLRAELAARGLAENTVVIFTGDNGYFLGDRGFADKWYIYEHSIRVPLVVFDPRAPQARRGVKVDAMALNVDLAPTLLDLAGAAIPPIMQGRSLTPLLRGETPPDWRKEFFYEHLMEADGVHFGKTLIPKSEGLRTERFTYVRWFESKPLVEELYDHQADFDETRNLLRDPAFAATVEALRRRTTELRDQYGGPFVSNAKPKAVKRPPAKKKAAQQSK